MKDALFVLLREVWHLFDSYTNVLQDFLSAIVLSCRENILCYHSEVFPHNV